MRALGNPKSSETILEGHKVYYNFVRPHMAREGKTPAEVAGLDLNLGENKWKGLIQKSVEKADIPRPSTAQSTVIGQQTLNGWYQP